MIRNKNPRIVVGLALSAILLSACGGTALVSTPIEHIDSIPLKVTDLTEAQKETWGFADLQTDTIPGMSINKAYEEIIGNRKGQKVIVAVLDSGIDLTHEDLEGVLWTNKGEKPGNNIDDDNNGYVDDIHGYNFLGEEYNEQLEATRIVRLKLGDAGLQARAKADLEADLTKAQQNKMQYEQILSAVQEADADIQKHLGKQAYTKKEVSAIKTEDPVLKKQVAIILQMYSFKDTVPEVLAELKDGIDYFTKQLNYNLNVDFDGRKITGDRPYDINDRGYGNGNPQARSADESHGTHVAGIIAADRNNGKGIRGIANHVEIMSIRAVPNGDEYDKDIALGIRYAVDNGARVINASFGKSFSPNAEWVYDAIKYAASKDVLIVHAAGNDGNDLDDPANANFPNDQVGNGPEMADNLITVGALDSKYGAEMVASYSNYGALNVDVFAPGSDIYSTNPGNKYEFHDGTSFAAPAVTGIAALIRSQYPKLTAPQVKRILMESGQTTNTTVILSGNTSISKPFSKISKSGRMVNAFNALIMAERVSKENS